MISQYTNIIFLISSFQEHFHVHQNSSDSKGLKLKSINMDRGMVNVQVQVRETWIALINTVYFGSLKQTNYS